MHSNVISRRKRKISKYVYIKCNIINQMKEETLQETRFLGLELTVGVRPRMRVLAIWNKRVQKHSQSFFKTGTFARYSHAELRLHTSRMCCLYRMLLRVYSLYAVQLLYRCEERASLVGHSFFFFTFARKNSVFLLDLLVDERASFFFFTAMPCATRPQHQVSPAGLTIFPIFFCLFSDVRQQPA